MSQPQFGHDPAVVLPQGFQYFHLGEGLAPAGFGHDQLLGLALFGFPGLIDKALELAHEIVQPVQEAVDVKFPVGRIAEVFRLVKAGAALDDELATFLA